jgi:lipoprotein-releasing system permease protein
VINSEQHMRYELFLAIRNLRMRRHRRLTRVTTLVAVSGIAIGVGALIIALALANGFRDEMRDKILRGTSHLTVMRSDGGPFADLESIRRTISEVPEVKSVVATTYDGVVLVGPSGTAYAVLRGVEINSPAMRSELDKLIVAGTAEPTFSPREGDLREVVIGVELAKRAGVKVNDVVEIISANSGSGSSEPIRRLVRVAGLSRTGLYEYDATWIYAALDLSAMLTGHSGKASVLSVQVTDLYEVKPVAALVKARLGSEFTTVDWQEANQPLFAALALERRMGFVVIGLIVLIAALNITTTLILVVVERRRDIAVLSAMGASSKNIMSIFMIEGVIIGACGAVAGVAFGVAGCLLANHYKLISLPADVYSISTVPFNLELLDMVAAAGIALLLSLFATLYPAVAASRVRPIEMLRDAG